MKIKPLQYWKLPRYRGAEDHLLRRYWEKAGGLIIADVRVGSSTKSRSKENASEVRSIDAIRIPLKKTGGVPPDIVLFSKVKEVFENFTFNNKTLEIIEIQYKLDRNVIGQVIVGADLMQMEHRPKEVGQTILCATGDPLLEKVCRRRKIKVVKV